MMDFNVGLLGCGSVTPDKCRTSEYYDALLGLEKGALLTATGVAQRYVCDTETQIDLAVGAIKNAVHAAEIEVRDVDLIISACGIPYQTLPSTGPLIMARLGIEDGRAAAFDVNSTCLSFLTGVETAQHLINSGQYKMAIVVSSEIASRALPWDTDPETAAIFGDGAAAVILGQNTAQGQGPVASLMRTFPSSYDACTIKSGGTRFDLHKQPKEFANNAVFQMDGRALFRITSKYFKGFVDDLLSKAGWALGDVDLVVPHQASPFALQHMAKITGIPAAKMIDITRDYGNQIAASIPFALDFAVRNGRISSGSKVLFLGTSAGVSFGGMAWEM